MRRAVLLVGAFALAAALAGSVWWYVKDHQRVGRADLQQTVVRKAGAERAVCVKRDSNAAHWLCAVLGPPAPRCMRVHVRPWGAVELHEAYRTCAADGSLSRYFNKAASS